MNDESNRQPSSAPLFAKLVAIGCVAGLGLVSVGAWQLARLRAEEEQRDCERAVAGREDNRAMWIWLGEQFPDDAVELGLPGQLADRLPSLRCVDGNPVPESEDP
jgi:hypothetical protein